MTIKFIIRQIGRHEKEGHVQRSHGDAIKGAKVILNDKPNILKVELYRLVTVVERVVIPDPFKITHVLDLTIEEKVKCDFHPDCQSQGCQNDPMTCQRLGNKERLFSV